MDVSSPSGLIVVESPIGVGKSTLARRLAESVGCEIVREAAEENPFMEHFYSNTRD
jgi:deoxyadenosine/deoxycytidine kinase